MLDLIADHRTANRPELVMLIRNEQIRLPWHIAYYSDLFDIVILDDSTDNTVEIACASRVTVYKRVPGNSLIEYYRDYVENHLAPGKFHVQMQSDEFVEKNMLYGAVKRCQVEGGILMGRRIDWAYNRRRVVPNSTTPRGARRGQFDWDMTSFHAMVHPPRNIPTRTIDFDHIHINSVTRRFGHLGTYAKWEIDGYFDGRHPTWRTFRRFVLHNLFYLPIDIWRERQNGIGNVIAFIGEHLADMGVGISGYAERRWLPNEKQQLEFHRSFFSPHPYDEK